MKDDQIVVGVVVVVKAGEESDGREEEWPALASMIQEGRGRP